ncbi:MAG TPA: SxtJ family membrane protein [Caldisericia bacterium]|nr:SxtJ family membrane protein [Caldisericia bacterium]
MKNTPTPKNNLLVISIGFLALYLIFHWSWAVYVALTVGLIGIFSPFLSQKVSWLWMQLSRVLSYIMPNILFSLVFFLILFPISLLYRIFHKDPLRLHNRYESNFIEVNKSYPPESFEKIW